MTDYYRLFNNTMNEFFDELIHVFPMVPDFKTLKTSLHWAIAIDKKMPEQVFHYCVTKEYSEHIFAEDENFFLKQTYKDYSGIMEQNNVDMNIVNVIKGVWGNLTDNNKKVIWKYMKVLVTISTKCENPI
jgi:hypothetical protein